MCYSWYLIHKVSSCELVKICAALGLREAGKLDTSKFPEEWPQKDCSTLRSKCPSIPYMPQTKINTVTPQPELNLELSVPLAVPVSWARALISFYWLQTPDELSRYIVVPPSGVDSRRPGTHQVQECSLRGRTPAGDNRFNPRSTDTPRASKSP